MVALVQVTARGRQTLNVVSSGIIVNHANFVHTDQCLSAFLSGNTSGEEGGMFLPVLNILLALYHDAPV